MQRCYCTVIVLGPFDSIFVGDTLKLEIQAFQAPIQAYNQTSQAKNSLRSQKSLLMSSSLA